VMVNTPSSSSEVRTKADGGGVSVVVIP
jgi:hypothetical protein